MQYIYLIVIFTIQDRMVRYEVTARLIRVGIFNFDIARSHVLDFRRPAAPLDVTANSPPAINNLTSSYMFGSQMDVRGCQVYFVTHIALFHWHT